MPPLLTPCASYMPQQAAPWWVSLWPWLVSALFHLSFLISCFPMTLAASSMKPSLITQAHALRGPRALWGQGRPLS